MRLILPLLLLWAAPALAAQDPPAPQGEAPPEAKGLTITESGVDRLAVGAELRLRGEYRNPRTPLAGASASTTGWSRATVYVDLKANEWLSAYVEGQGRQGPSGSVTNAGLQQGFVQLTKALEYLDAKGGRFEMSFGSGRMVNPQDWLQAPFTFDGAVLEAVTGQLRVAGFYTQAVKSQGGFSFDTDFMGLYATMQLSPLWLIDGYALRVQDDSVFQDVWTYGGRLHGEILTGLELEFELAVQRGTVGARFARGQAYVIELTYALDAGHNLGLGWSYASGDNKPWDRNAEVFIPVYPDQHRFNGIADIVVWSNLSDFVFRYWLQIDEQWGIHSDLHYFLLPTPVAGIFPGPGGAGITGTGKDDLGLELDLYVLGAVGEHLYLQAGAAYFDAGPAILAGRNQVWVYGQLAVSF